jgi:hypothetical protein
VLLPEALDGAVAHGHGLVKLIEAEDDMDVVRENRGRSLAIWLWMARIPGRVGSCGMQSSQDGCKNKNKDRTVVEFRFHHEHEHVSEGRLMAPFARRSLEVTATALVCRRSCGATHAPHRRRSFVASCNAQRNGRRCRVQGPRLFFKL